MLFEFQVPVITLAKPKRAKSIKLVAGFVRHTVDVPMYTSDEAPIAIRGNLFGDENIDGEHVPLREFRTIGEHVYADVTGDCDGKIHTSVDEIHGYGRLLTPFERSGRWFRDILDKYAKGRDRYGFYPVSQAPNMAKGHVENLEELSSLDLVDVSEEMVTRCIEEFEKDASRIALVDEQILIRERPPVIEVSHQYVRENLRKTAIRAVRRDLDGPLVRYGDVERFYNPLAYFALDELEAAMDFASSLGSPVQNELDDLFLLDGTPVAFNGSSATIHAHAIYMNEQLIDHVDRCSGGGRKLLEKLSPAIMDAFWKLENMLPFVEEENIPDGLAEVVETILALPTAERAMFVHPDVESLISAAVALWDNRPMALTLTPSAHM